MKKIKLLLSIALFLLVNQTFAQNDDVLNPFDGPETEAKNVSAPTSAPTSAPAPKPLDPEHFITEDYQIPSYNLYLQDWNTEYLKIKSLGISFGNNADIKIILVDNNNPFVMPCKNFQVSSNYGVRKSGTHTGVDLATQLDEPVYSCFDGVVRMAREYSSYGKTVVVRHYNGLETVYAHLDSILVQPNEKVVSGQQIGMAGNSGRSTGVHLHFETRFLYEHFDPAKMVDFATGELLSNVLTITKAELDFAADADQTAASTPTTTTKPATSTTAVSDSYYVVKQGDTLYAIAKKHGLSLDKLLKMNNLTEESVLQLGQKIRVK